VRAFSDKWLDVAARCGNRPKDFALNGFPILAGQIDAKLASGQFDALTSFTMRLPQA